MHAYTHNEAKLLEVSRFFKIISDPTRLSILFYLREGAANVSQIADVVYMEQSAVSHQLKTLKDARLVKSHREGKHMVYELDDHHVFGILDQVSDHLSENHCHS